MDDSASGDGSSARKDQNRNPPTAATIVGGRPNARGYPLHRIPQGIEVLVKKASVDSQFRTLLLEKRAGAAALIDLELSPAEAAMIEAVPRDQLERIIDYTTVPEEHRRIFLGKIGCLMLALLGAGAALLLLAPYFVVTKGLSPDHPDRRHDRMRKEPRDSPAKDQGPVQSSDDSK